MNIIDRAKALALVAHDGMTYGESSYFDGHLTVVVGVVREFGFDTDSCVASAYLHDAVEDTEVTYDDVLTKFGPVIADMVAFCTDSEGPNRRTRKARNRARWELALENPAAHILDAVVIKLSDRVANLRTCVAQNNARLLSMYRKEAKVFRDVLDIGTPSHRGLWEEIDRLLRG